MIRRSTLLMFNIRVSRSGVTVGPKLHGEFGQSLVMLPADIAASAVVSLSHVSADLCAAVAFGIPVCAGTGLLCFWRGKD